MTSAPLNNILESYIVLHHSDFSPDKGDEEDITDDVGGDYVWVDKDGENGTMEVGSTSLSQLAQSHLGPFEVSLALDLNSFLEEIVLGQSLSDCIHQFTIDCPRSQVVINDTEITSDKVGDVVTKICHAYSPTVAKQLLMCATQAVLSLPYRLVQTAIHNIDDSCYVGEIGVELAYRFPFSRHRIDIKMDSDRLRFAVRKRMRVFIPYKDFPETLAYLFLFLDFDILNDPKIILQIIQEPITATSNKD